MMLNCRGKIITLDYPVVMGIINMTGDSFYAGSRTDSTGAALSTARRMCAEGAAIIDIGAQSTRPGARMLGEKEEWTALAPVLKEIRRALPEVLISVDTFHAFVARNAAAEGADIINDISAGTLDARMLETVADTGLPYIMMHMQGTPENMQHNPVYNDVVSDVLLYLSERIEKARQAGIKDIIIDPGIGFGKTPAHNFKLLAHLEAFVQTGYPVLVGVSRKSLIYKTLGLTPEEALNGTTVLNTIALQKGASILRVHDVRESVEVVKLLNMVNTK